MAARALNQSELDFFHSEGYLRLSLFHSKDTLQPLRESILRELSRLKVWAGGKRLGRSLSDLSPFQQISKLSSMVKIAGLDETLNTAEIRSAIAGLTGRTPHSSQGSQPLLSLPHQGPWSLRNLAWHVDVAAKPEGEIPGIQAFYLIDDVGSHGGATLALARSHRLAGELAGRLRGSLKMSGDLEAALRASNTEIIEMSGRAGDVFLMDIRVLHTPSVNSANRIRMMATTRFTLRASR
ncbi:MAG: phytanoyl-CoA dioxygenase family protein [Achromobacter sp.]|uniref:phytanoyl-CoA dioxygenase family protein n=1 Tax=Achromobacter sp. TaxID=134375 RepID=UPI003CFC696C